MRLLIDGYLTVKAWSFHLSGQAGEMEGQWRGEEGGASILLFGFDDGLKGARLGQRLVVNSR